MRDVVIDKVDGWLECGPVAVAAVTGTRLSLVERAFRRAGWIEGAGASADVVDLALAQFGMGLTRAYVADCGEDRRPLWWVLRFFDDAPLIIAVDDEGQSHWVATCGWRTADARTLWPLDRVVRLGPACRRLGLVGV